MSLFLSVIFDPWQTGNDQRMARREQTRKTKRKWLGIERGINQFKKWLVLRKLAFTVYIPPDSRNNSRGDHG